MNQCSIYRMMNVAFALRLACLCLLGLVIVGCSRHKYVAMSLDELEKHASFGAVVEKTYLEKLDDVPTGAVVLIGLKCDDGARIAIQGANTNPALVMFSKTLIKGRHYQFPACWLDYNAKAQGASEL